MALGALPSLTEIKAELGSANNDLISFISEAGKAGVWTSQLDFANYTYATIYASPSSLNFPRLTELQSTTVTSYTYGWALFDYPAWIGPIQFSGCRHLNSDMILTLDCIVFGYKNRILFFSCFAIST